MGQPQGLPLIYIKTPQLKKIGTAHIELAGLTFLPLKKYEITVLISIDCFQKIET